MNLYIQVKYQWHDYFNNNNSYNFFKIISEISWGDGANFLYFQPSPPTTPPITKTLGDAGRQNQNRKASKLELHLVERRLL